MLKLTEKDLKAISRSRYRESKFNKITLWIFFAYIIVYFAKVAIITSITQPCPLCWFTLAFLVAAIGGLVLIGYTVWLSIAQNRKEKIILATITKAYSKKVVARFTAKRGKKK